MRVSLQEAVSAFGREARSKLSNPVASGAPEDQLRAPLEALIPGLAELAGLHPGTVVMVGETALSDIKTRPDYAVTRGGALVGFIEVKAPGKGADPRRFRDRHDREQWAKLQTLPNLIYTDGNGFSLWRKRLARRRRRSVGGRRGDRWRQAGRPRPSRVPVRGLLPMGAGAAPVSTRTRRHHGPALPLAARRGDGAAGTRLALAHQPSRGTGAGSCSRALRTKPSRTATRRRSPSGF